MAEFEEQKGSIGGEQPTQQPGVEKQPEAAKQPEKEPTPNTPAKEEPDIAPEQPSHQAEQQPTPDTPGKAEPGVAPQQPAPETPAKAEPGKADEQQTQAEAPKPEIDPTADIPRQPINVTPPKAQGRGEGEEVGKSPQTEREKEAPKEPTPEEKLAADADKVKEKGVFGTMMDDIAEGIGGVVDTIKEKLGMETDKDEARREENAKEADKEGDAQHPQQSHVEEADPHEIHDVKPPESPTTQEAIDTKAKEANKPLPPKGDDHSGGPQGGPGAGGHPPA